MNWTSKVGWFCTCSPFPGGQQWRTMPARPSLHRVIGIAATAMPVLIALAVAGFALLRFVDPTAKDFAASAASALLALL